MGEFVVAERFLPYTVGAVVFGFSENQDIRRWKRVYDVHHIVDGGVHASCADRGESESVWGE